MKRASASEIEIESEDSMILFRCYHHAYLFA